MVFNKGAYINEIKIDETGTNFELQENTIEYDENNQPFSEPILRMLTIKDGMIYFNRLDCTDLNLVKDRSFTEHESFTLQDARKYFTESTSRLNAMTRPLNNNMPIRLSTGNFVPDWDKAVASARKDMLCYDIPIESEYTYKAILLPIDDGEPDLSVVNVYQKLLVLKNVRTESLGQYILTLIPDVAYEKLYAGKVADRFINAGEIGDFSGLAIYTIPSLDLIVRANRYVNGVKKQGVFMYGKKEERANKTVYLKRSILNKICLFRCPMPFSSLLPNAQNAVFNCDSLGNILPKSCYIDPFDQGLGLDEYDNLVPSDLKDSLVVSTKSGNSYTVKAFRLLGWDDGEPGDYNVVEIYKDEKKIYDMLCIMGWLYFPSRHTKSSTPRCCYAVNMGDDAIALVFHGIYISSENPQIAIVVLKEDKATLVFNKTSDINEIRTSDDGVTTFILQENVQEYDIIGKPITAPILDILKVNKDGIYFYKSLR